MNVKNIALIGNPNTGKSSLFNQLTGLKQHIGNYPGVTVDKKIGEFNYENRSYTIVDLPGIYSLYGESEEEKVVLRYISDKDNSDYPDLFIVVVDASNLERNLLLFTQIYDLKLPVILVLNLIDEAEKKNIRIDLQKFSEKFNNLQIVKTNARTSEGIIELKSIISNFTFQEPNEEFYSSFGQREKTPESHIKETTLRFKKIKTLLSEVVTFPTTIKSKVTQSIDRILLHKFLSIPILFIVLFTVFQTVFYLSEAPMDWIDGFFSNIQEYVAENLPDGPLFELIHQGLIPGIGGVVIFVPQIALLFFLLSVLEETGYMTRVVFLLDRIMKPFGLNGRSIVPLVSGFGCAIPGIMATRTIENWKERIITIMVTPFISCAARLPVYAILIALIIPDGSVFGIFSLKGIALFGLYFLGVISAFIVAWIFKLILKSKSSSYLILEMPEYKVPQWKNIALHVLEKCKVFVWNAGKVIVMVSIILWVLATRGPGICRTSEGGNIPLDKSYIGIAGKAIEPVLQPLGYDWKMGIAIITSFAAREVFVGTMATIYGVSEEENEGLTLQEKMKNDKNEITGKPNFTFASGMSLMIFYVFAMQCASTFAVVYRETKSYKWPIIQFVFMSAVAYLGALLTYQILS